MSQALCVEYLAAKRSRLAVGVHDVPIEIGREAACVTLAGVGVAIDVLTPEQLAYAASWQSRT